METVTYISTKFPGSAKDLLMSKSKATIKYLLFIDDFPHWSEQIVKQKLEICLITWEAFWCDGSWVVIFDKICKKNEKYVGKLPVKLPDERAVVLGRNQEGLSGRSSLHTAPNR